MLEQFGTRVRAAAARFRDYQLPTSIPDSLELLDDLRRHRLGPLKHSGPSLFIQHHLAHYAPRLTAAIEDGLPAEKVWFLDIPYSTSPVVQDWIRHRFGEESLAPAMTDALAPYYATQESRLVGLLDAIAERCRNERLLVVDDGAYFMKYVVRLWETAPEQAERFRGSRVVEQTTRGHNLLASPKCDRVMHELDISAVSIALSRTKVIFEAPFIGAAIGRRLVLELEERSFAVNKALVLGYGSIGNACATAITQKLLPAQAVHVVETDSRKLSEIRSRGFRAYTEISHDDGTEFDLVLGCSGVTSFLPSDRTILSESALLASGSSASIEFDREHFVDEADRHDHDPFELLGDRSEYHTDIHSDMAFAHENGKRFTILNAGFPINFTGALAHMPTEAIEPTHCLLHAATVEVCTRSRPGLSSLDAEDDKWLLKAAVARL